MPSSRKGHLTTNPRLEPQASTDDTHHRKTHMSEEHGSHGKSDHGKNRKGRWWLMPLDILLRLLARTLVDRTLEEMMKTDEEEP
ncbi:hypothetical protein [Nocardiopsis alba]